MKRLRAVAAGCLFAVATPAVASAPTPLAPWFDADGFYNKADVGLARATSELATCRAEAARLKVARNRLAGPGRTRFDASPDRGFAALVAAQEPADGQLNAGELSRSYYAAELAMTPFENAALPSTTPPQAVVEVEATEAAANGTPLDLSRLAGAELAHSRPGMAIIVVGASQKTNAMQTPMGGDTFRFKRVTPRGEFLELLRPSPRFAARSYFNPDRRKDPSLAGEMAASRYSTYQIPAGRYVLSDLGKLNACLGALTFEAADGDVLYLGDFVLRPPGIPVGAILNPIGNLNSGMDNRVRSDLRVGIGDSLDAARQALQAGAEEKARLHRAQYSTGYRIPCDGAYIGRVENPDWPVYDADQSVRFHEALAAAAATAR